MGDWRGVLVRTDGNAYHPGFPQLLRLLRTPEPSANKNRKMRRDGKEMKSKGSRGWLDIGSCGLGLILF